MKRLKELLGYHCVYENGIILTFSNGELISKFVYVSGIDLIHNMKRSTAFKKSSYGNSWYYSGHLVYE